MIREDLVSSAVSFLQDPSVAASPLDKRTAFLHSKNLTQEEIDIALARAGEDPAAVLQNTDYAPNQSNYNYSSQQAPRVPQGGHGYPYGPYQGGPWGQAPPPEPPRRDWRDWFIMATVTSGVSYGLYVVAKRYVMPLISPPTPPQLEQDKSDIDASFTRAFNLIDQLATDTETLKNAETERTAKLDTALHEVESVMSELKLASRRREEEGKRISDEVRALKDMIPKALEGWKSEGDGRLKELGNELKGLKVLIGTRVGGLPAPPSPVRGFGVNRSGNNTPSSVPAPTPGYTYNDKDGRPTAPESNGIYGDRRPNSRAAIPAWQMAAAGDKNKDAAMSASGKVSNVGEESVNREENNRNEEFVSDAQVD